jgi:hypothetical protein
MFSGACRKAPMTKSQQLQAKADHFAARAAAAKDRTIRNTYLSLEQSVRAVAASEARAEEPRPSAANAD